MQTAPRLAGVSNVVKPKPACRHCGATLEHGWSRCPRCGRRSLLSLIMPRGPEDLSASGASST